MKVGTAVVTRSDGRLAITRIGSLVEQVCEAIGKFAAFPIQDFR